MLRKIISPFASFLGRPRVAKIHRKCASLLVLVIVLYGVWHSFMGYAVAPDPEVLSQESRLMNELEQRLAPLRDSLSADQTFGYVTAVSEHDALSATYRYPMARYILAPTVIFDDPDRRLLIVDLPDAATLDAYVKRHDLTVLDQPVATSPGLAIAAQDMP